jgi:hypothetical protein
MFDNYTMPMPFLHKIVLKSMKDPKILLDSQKAPLTKLSTKTFKQVPKTPNPLGPSGNPAGSKPLFRTAPCHRPKLVLEPHKLEAASDHPFIWWSQCSVMEVFTNQIMTKLKIFLNKVQEKVTMNYYKKLKNKQKIKYLGLDKQKHHKIVFLVEIIYKSNKTSATLKKQQKSTK